MAVVGATSALAAQLLRGRGEPLPREVAEVARACVLDTLGVGLLGCREPLVEKLDDIAAEHGSAAQCTVWGRSTRRSLADAALLNASAAHALDYDDMHIGAAMHPSAPVLAAGLAMAQVRATSGGDLLRAMVLGLEAELRIGECINPSHYRRGWHATGTLGHFGAAAAAGTLLALDAVQMEGALGLAATQSCGLKQTFGSMAKPFHAGHAARDGVMAAVLAARGFTCGSEMLEGPHGYGAAMSAEPDWSGLVRDWGERWALSDILFKPHASSFCTQALIEGVIRLRGSESPASGVLQAIRASVSGTSMRNATIVRPATGMEAKFSLSFAAAHAWVYGRAEHDDFTDDRVAEHPLNAVREKVAVTAGPGVAWPEAVVEIDFAGGTTKRVHVDLAREMDTAPKKWAVAVHKFRKIAPSVMGAARAERIIEVVQTIDEADSVDDLLALLAGTPGQG